MDRNNLIAYIPVLNKPYLEWLEKHEPFNLFLISKRTAESLIPRLARNLGAISEIEMILMIHSLEMNGNIDIFFLSPSGIPSNVKKFIMPDEDVCRALAKKYLHPKGYKVRFEQIWGRWDMTAVKRREPAIPDLEISSEKIDKFRMKIARRLAQKSPDWWRQIGALAFRGERIIACAYNQHYPTEYETVLFSDPRVNYDAGDPAGAEVYLSLHAEKGLVGTCARLGVELKGASVYVTSFPCSDCARLLAECRIKELLFKEGYSTLKGLESLRAANVRVVKVV